MRLLIVTQIVDKNDPVLGFFHEWITAFAAHVEQIEVICLYEGTHTLPNNVRVHSLGKEKGVRSSLSYAVSFLKLVWQLRTEYDAVFVHMNPEYLVLAGLFWRLTKKRTILWYTHKKVDIKLRLATFFVDVVCTASKESFLLKTPKLRVMGHGIDLNVFKPQPRREGTELRIVTTGRLSRTKRIIEMLDVLDILNDRGIQFEFTIIGAPATEADFTYVKEIARHILLLSWKDRVTLAGPIPHASLPHKLWSEDVFLNLSDTGSLDKAVLEALACGVAVVSSNPAFRDLLPPTLFIEDGDPERIADAVEIASQTDLASAQETIREKHSLSRLIPAILAVIYP